MNFMNSKISSASVVTNVSLILFTMFLFSSTAKASLQQQMERTFNMMVSSTPPTHFDTQRRGGVAGGSLHVRTPIMDERLITILPPSFEAGCGGIDLFMGSFSFISADQFIQLMRSIAANAAGYAFQLALGAICESCQNTMEALQKKIQELNQMHANSCQLAKGLVTGVRNAAREAKTKEGGLVSMVSGAASDVFTAMTKTSNRGPLEQAEQADPKKFEGEITGNLAWRALKKAGTSSWFAGGNDSLDEVIMNLTGAIIVAKKEQAEDGKGTTLPERRIPPSTTITLRTLIEGGEVKVHVCDGYGANQCLKPSENPQSRAIVGLKVKLRGMLIGDENSPGLLQKHRGNVIPTISEQSILGHTELGGALIHLNAQSAFAAQSVAEKAIPHMAVALARSILDQLIRTMEVAFTDTSDQYAKEQLQMIMAARAAMDTEYAAIQREMGSLLDLMSYMWTMRQILQNAPGGMYSVNGGAR